MESCEKPVVLTDGHIVGIGQRLLSTLGDRDLVGVACQPELRAGKHGCLTGSTPADEDVWYAVPVDVACSADPFGVAFKESQQRYTVLAGVDRRATRLVVGH